MSWTLPFGRRVRNNIFFEETSRWDIPKIGSKIEMDWGSEKLITDRSISTENGIEKYEIAARGFYCLQSMIWELHKYA